MLSKEGREKIIQSRLGSHWSEEIKLKIGESNFGKKRTEEFKTKRKNDYLNKKRYNDKGENTTKERKHKWVECRLGKASNYFCKICGKIAKDWANKNHTYKKILDDYISLCHSCHMKYDHEYNGKEYAIHKRWLK